MEATHPVRTVSVRPIAAFSPTVAVEPLYVGVTVSCEETWGALEVVVRRRGTSVARFSGPDALSAAGYVALKWR